MILEKKNFRMFKIKDKKRFELKSILVFLILMLIFQIIYYKKIVAIRPFVTTVPIPPNEKAIDALTFGDKEFYFRIKSFKVQTMGDTFGNTTPLADYDYKKLYFWMNYLDKFNSKSNYLASIAAYYYGSTPNKDDTIYIIKFLEEHADKNLKENWWWLYQATYLARYVYNDNDLSLRLAKKLRETSPETAPLWTKKMEGIFLFDSNELCESLRVMTDILDNYANDATRTDEEKAKELNYMKFFIEKNIERLNNSNIDYNDCYKKEGR